MANDYVLATNESGELAVRTVSATEASNITDTLSVITRTDDGKLAVRTVGGSGGGDSHNKGYFATLAELQEAYPTGEAGDWAIVAESDTVYIWDDTQQAWVDTDQKGQVTSVNGQTGDVVIPAGATYTAGNGISIDANNEISVTAPTLQNTATGSNSITIGGTATASGNAVNIGASSSTTGGQSVVVGQGARATANATIVIGQVASASGQEGIAIGNGASAAGGSAIQLGYGTNSTANTFKIRNYEIMSADGTIPEARLADTTNAQQGDVLTLDSTGNAVWQAGGGGGLPSQTGNAGKFLTTDGTDASWGTELTDALVIRRSSATDNCLILYNRTFFGSIYMDSSSSSFFFNRGLKVGGDLLPGFNGYNLGSSSRKWVLYSETINNGANIAVPTTGGTMVVATPPSADGTYVLKATVVDGVVTTAWVAE